ncbi:hypothetical protein TCAL_13072 [Tigriopus californicus]|uniref:DUF5641 domain-containing protein n=1 Tax=Tigriopus californicus TaxID=6832 RepID=A0A553PPR0_TIGCA|nr:hypothetical protein TCAL_13072 [Tigriopus californicus]|eukprot:TCALIF_13072-PA protein Name:"Protein of unknown function" AED:0.62 eAED:0.62 QI:0/0/0/0.5/1/1/2/0/189
MHICEDARPEEFPKPCTVARNIPYACQDPTKEAIDKMEKQDVIRIVQEPTKFVAPFLAVQKKDAIAIREHPWDYQRTLLPAYPSKYARLSNEDERLHVRGRKDKNVKQKTVYDSNSRQLRKLAIGQQVRIRDPQESTWSKTGTILQIRRSGRSYLVQSNGRTSLRNRIYLKPMRDGPISAVPETAQEIP